MKCRICKLGDVADITKLAGFEYTKYISYVEDGEIIALRALNLRNGELDLTDIKKISKNVSEQLIRSKLFSNDILLTYTGNGYGDCAFITENDKYHLAPNICKITPKKDIINSYYLYTFIRSNTFRMTLTNYIGGSSQPTIPMRTLRMLEIPYFDIYIQDKIAEYIYAIDEKIRINTAINKNLEEQAQAIFAKMIVGNEKNGFIGDYCNIKSGFAFKSKWWQNSGVPVIKIRSIMQDYLNLSDCSYVSEDKILFAKDYVVTGGDLLIAMTGATIGKFAIVPKVNETILVNQRVGKFFLGSKPISKLPFIYCTLKQPDILSEVINRGQGSAQPNISASNIMSIPCVIPNSRNIDIFNKETSPMFESIIDNQHENAVLANIRDTILPRLMSGEIDVSGIEI